jgi:hypothetical protein
MDLALVCDRRFRVDAGRVRTQRGDLFFRSAPRADCALRATHTRAMVAAVFSERATKLRVRIQENDEA